MTDTRTRVFSHNLTYQIDKKYFSTLTPFEQNQITEMANELNNIKTKSNNNNNFVNIERLLKEGSIIKRYGEKLFPEDRNTSKKSNYTELFYRVFNLSPNHFYHRVKMLNINPIIINMYYENFIILYDLQMLTSYTKEGQLKVLEYLLKSINRYTSKDDRSVFFSKAGKMYYQYKHRLPVHVNKTVKRVVVDKPICKIDYVKEKKYNSSDEKEKFDISSHNDELIKVELKPNELVKVELKPTLTTTTTNDKFYVYSKDSNKIEETTENPIKKQQKEEIPLVIRVEEEKQQQKPKTEKEYYENLEMVVPPKEKIEDWKKANGY